MAVFESENTITDVLCDTIIEDFEDISEDIYIIPKNDKLWGNIERILYKELLIKLNEFKINLLTEINENNELILLLNKTLYIKDFVIQKISSNRDENFISKYYFVPNRYNVLTFIFYLNDVDGGEMNISIEKKYKMIKPKMGKLLLFQEDIKYPYKYKLPLDDLYIITGQLCYANIL